MRHPVNLIRLPLIIDAALYFTTYMGKDMLQFTTYPCFTTQSGVRPTDRTFTACHGPQTRSRFSTYSEQTQQASVSRTAPGGLHTAGLPCTLGTNWRLLFYHIPMVYELQTTYPWQEMQTAISPRTSGTNIQTTVLPHDDCTNCRLLLFVFFLHVPAVRTAVYCFATYSWYKLQAAILQRSRGRKCGLLSYHGPRIRTANYCFYHISIARTAVLPRASGTNCKLLFLPHIHGTECLSLFYHLPRVGIADCRFTRARAKLCGFCGVPESFFLDFWLYKFRD